MYSNAAAIFRADITGALVEQASGWEKNLIGERALPILNVEAKNGLYPVLNLAAGSLLRNDVKARAPYTTFARGARAYDQDTYNTQEYGFEEAVDDTIQKDMLRFFNAEQVAARLALRKLRIAHEIRSAAILFAPATFATTATGTAWTIANIATFDAGYDVELALGRLRSRGEDSSQASVVMSSDVFTRVRASTKMQNRLRGIGISSDTILNVSEAAVAEAMGVKEVLVGKAYYDSSLEGAVFSGSAVWSNTYVWIGNIGSAGGVDSIFNGGAAFTLNWGQYGPPFAVETYREEDITSDIVRAKQHVTEKVVNSNAGTLTDITWS